MVEVRKSAQKVQKKDFFLACNKPSCSALGNFFHVFMKTQKTTFARDRTLASFKKSAKNGHFCALGTHPPSCGFVLFFEKKKKIFGRRSDFKVSGHAPKCIFLQRIHVFLFFFFFQKKKISKRRSDFRRERHLAEIFFCREYTFFYYFFFFKKKKSPSGEAIFGAGTQNKKWPKCKNLQW